MRVADLNGNGRPDVITGDGQRGIAVLLNTDSGIFRQPVSYAALTNGFIQDFDVGDIDGDGDIDVVVFGDRRAVAFTNNGDGIFQNAASTTFPTGSITYAVSLVDMTGDGTLDLIAAGQTTGVGATVSVFAGNGEGTFTATATVVRSIEGSSSLRFMARVDLDGDGDEDLIAGDSAQTAPTVATLLNHGNAGLGIADVYAGGSNATSAAAADVTGDGIADLLVHDMTSGLRIIPGLGSGAFDAAAAFSIVVQVHANAPIAVGDVNGDGLADVSSWTLSNGQNDMLLGTPSGLALMSYPPTSTDMTGYLGTRTELADVNADGLDDLIVFAASGSEFGTGYNTPAQVSVILSDGTGNFRWEDLLAERRTALAAGEQARDFMLADIDGDGWLDAVDTAWYDSLIEIAWGRGDGTFEPPTQIQTPAHPTGSAGLARFDDFDGDGRLDLFMADANGRLLIARQQSDRNFPAPTPVFTDPLFAGSSSSVRPRLARADVNGDGHVDVVASSDRLLVLLGNGDGTFVRQAAGEPTHTGGTVYLELADVDGDGHSDAVAITGENLVLWRGIGNGSFALSQVRSFGVGSQQPRIADVTGDARPELLFAGHTTAASNITVIGWNDETDALATLGSLAPPATHDGGLVRFDAGDLNGDGMDDLVIVRTTNANYAEVHLRTGDLAFAPPRYHMVSYGGTDSWTPAVGDLNLDGQADLVALLGGSVFTLRNIAPAVPDEIAPTAESVSTRFTGFVPTVRFVFNESLSIASVSPSDLHIEHVATGQTFVSTAVRFADGNRGIVFELPTTLPDGEYRFTLAAGAVSDRGGNPTTVAITLSDRMSFVLAGDANRDRSVNFSDLLILAQNYGQTDRAFSQGNFNYSSDGLVDFDDLLLLAQRYGTSLAVSVPEVAKPSSPAMKRKSTISQVEM